MDLEQTARIVYKISNKNVKLERLLAIKGLS